MSEVDRFCVIIDKYCNSLADLLIDIRTSTEKSTKLIMIKKIRSKKTDSYVSVIDEFNNILYSIAQQIKEVIGNLTCVFVNKSVDTLVDFFKAINSLLIYLMQKDVFHMFNTFKQMIEEKIKDDLEMIDKINRVCHIVFKIFNMTLTITTILVPQISFIIPAINGLEAMAEQKVDDMKVNAEAHKLEIERITRKLMDVQTRSEILEEIDTNNIHSCLHDKAADDLVVKIEQLHADYNEVLYLMSSLKYNIRMYFTKKKCNFLGLCW